MPNSQKEVYCEEFCVETRISSPSLPPPLQIKYACIFHLFCVWESVKKAEECLMNASLKNINELREATDISYSG